MSQENVKPEQIQASVAAALSRLRGDAAPPSDAPDNSPAAGPAVAGPGTRPEPMRAANDLRADPGLRAVHTAPMSPMAAAAQSAAQVRPEPEPLAARDPELPRAMFTRPGPTMGSTMSGQPAQPGQPEAPKTPTVQRPASPLARMMTRDTEGAGSAAPAAAPTVEKAASPAQQPDLLAGLPPPPLGDALTQETDDAGARRRRNRRILALVAAIVVVVVGFWLWSSGGGDPADVPVITADATPEKVKPEDEGGLQVPNQNVQVLDNMSSGEQAAETETVLPPPEQPVAPPEPTVAEVPAVEPPAVVDSGSAAVEDVPAAAAPTVTAPEPTSAEAPAAPTPPAPEPEATQQAEAPAAPAIAAPEPAAPASEAASAPEPTPAPAPEPTPAPAATQEAAVTPPPAPAAVGNSRIQLAAVKSEDSARAEWAKMQKAHPDLLGNLTLTVERVDKSGTVFYRIQAGPLADKGAAKDLCTSLKSRGQDCIVAR